MAPAAPGKVARIAPTRAGLFMTEQVGEGKFAPQIGKRRRQRANAHVQRQSEGRQPSLQLGHASERDVQMAPAALEPFHHWGAMT